MGAVDQRLADLGTHFRQVDAEASLQEEIAAVGDEVDLRIDCQPVR